MALQLKWHHQFQFAGYYAAQARGYYRDAGLEVSILEGGAGISPMDVVLSGAAQFGVGDSELVLARVQGQPVVACAAIFQHSPYVLLSRRDRDIRTPADLIGATVMLADDQGAVQFRAMLIREGIDPGRVRIVPHSWRLTDLVNGKVDAISAYATVEPAQLRALGVEPSTLRSRDYGVDFYGDTLFTTEAQVAADHQRVAAFRRASLAGWVYAMAHPEEIADLILKLPGAAARGMTRDRLLQEARAMRPLILPEVVEIGHMNPGRWQHVADTFASLGMAPPDPGLDGFLFDPDPPAQPALPRWTKSLAAAGLTLTALVVIWTLQMRWQVRARTRELHQEVVQRQETEHHLRLQSGALEAAANAIVITNRDGLIQWSNAAFTASTGYAAAEAVGLSIPDLLGSGEEDGTFHQAIWKTILGGEVWRGELTNRRKDGSLYPEEVMITPLRDDTGEITHFISVTQDISERQRAEAQVREQASLLDKARDAIMVRDLRDRITYWNKGAERLYGWSAAEAVGRSVAELLYRKDDKFEEASRAVLRAGEWTGELTPVNRAGQEVIVESRWTLVRDGAGQPQSILSISTDISERKSIEAQFLRAQRLESIGTLAGGIAHDLNNVLAPILLSIELLRARATDPRSQRLLETIEGSAQRGARMVQQVLSFASGASGKRVLTSMADLIRDLERIVHETFPKSIECRCQVAPDLWPVLGDPTQLHQVLLNLCVNSRDAMPEGGVLAIEAVNIVIDEGSALSDRPGRSGPHVLLRVTDSGHGIAPELLERIFDPFFTSKEVGKGTGLGLSTVASIVKAHNGLVGVESEVGRGTTFELYLPAELQLNPERIGANAAILPRGEGELVLVVDDEAAVRAIARQTLEDFGYRVLLAVDGAEAVALYQARQTEIAVVLTDMNMPVLDGRSTIAALLEINPRVRLIAASGRELSHSISTDFGVGGLPFLAKPYTAASLLGIVREVIAR